jgi:hypothetical protein
MRGASADGNSRLLLLELGGSCSFRLYVNITIYFSFITSSSIKIAENIQLGSGYFWK